MPIPNDPLNQAGEIPDKPETKEEQEKRQKEERKRPGHSPLYWFIFALIVVAAALLVIFIGWLPRHKREEAIDKQAQERTEQLPRVNVEVVKYAPSTTELMVPGTTMAYTEAYIY